MEQPIPLSAIVTVYRVSYRHLRLCLLWGRPVGFGMHCCHSNEMGCRV
jgi:hypothetical protein